MKARRALRGRTKFASLAMNEECRVQNWGNSHYTPRGHVREKRFNDKPEQLGLSIFSRIL